MAKDISAKITGPFKGMDLYDIEPNTSTYWLGLNVDTSSGRIEPRPPMRSHISSVGPVQMYALERPGVPRVLLMCGPQVATTHVGSTAQPVYLRAYHLDNLTILDNAVNLQTQFGEPPVTRSWRCSFEEATLADNGATRVVVLISTPHCVYVYDPLKGLLGLRQLTPATDSLQINGLNASYWSSLPKGPITCTHQGRIYYAGFRDGDTADMDTPLAEFQTDVDEALLSADRLSLGLQPSMVVWSDEFDPAGLRADHYLAIDQGDAVTGLISTGDVLYIFARQAIYVLSGYSDATFTLQKLVSGVGCVAPGSLVQAGQAIYFMGPDGIYAFGGVLDPTVVKISGGIDPLWSGWQNVPSYIPDAMRTRLSQLGFPWTINPGDLYRSIGKYHRGDRQIWWSLPVDGKWYSHAFAITAVLNLDTMGFNLYCQSPRASNQVRASCMYDAVWVDQTQTWICSNAQGHIMTQGDGITDGLGDSDDCGVPMYWVSGRLAGTGFDQLQANSVCVKLLNTGDWVTGQGGSPVTVGSDSIPRDVPIITVEGEEAIHDAETDTGVAVTDYAKRRTVTKQLRCTPNTGSLSVCGAAVTGTAKARSIGWFTTRVGCTLSSRTMRVGVIDDPYTVRTRPPAVHILALELDVVSTGNKSV